MSQTISASNGLVWQVGGALGCKVDVGFGVLVVGAREGFCEAEGACVTLVGDNVGCCVGLGNVGT